MNGAEALMRTLVGAGVDVCFMNPGTSEMHFVASLDAVSEMRPVLALFEGVATGAADGYARMAGRPAATLLHLGPGLGNGLANLHNARRAGTPMIVIVGDHATYHRQYDALLDSDIDTVARNVSGFIRTLDTHDSVGPVTAEAVAVATGPPGQIATLIVPADVSWEDGPTASPPAPERPPADVDQDTIEAIVTALRSDAPAALLIGGAACRADGLRAASRIANHTGVRLLCETFPARLERGAGLPPVEKVAYFGEMAAQQMEGLEHLVVAGARAPVSFFAYPGKPSYLAPEDAVVHTLADAGDDVIAALETLADALGAPADGWTRQEANRPQRPTGDLDVNTMCRALGALLPEGAIVSDEGITAGIFAAAQTQGAPAHDWLSLTGGSIGQGLPVAVGAAVACPDRRVVALQADGSAMYTLQSWWTMVREDLDITTILINNSSYAILNLELQRVGAAAGGQRARDMLDLDRPALDFVALARGMGMRATRAATAEEFTEQLEASLATPGPSLVEAIVPSLAFAAG